MGSVSSLVNNSDSLNSKHCKTSDYRLRKGTNPQRKSGGCSIDGLLKCGFIQSSNHPPRGLSHSRSGRSEDFFYIKVSHKPRPAYYREGPMEDHERKRDGELDGRLQPKLLVRAGNVMERASAEKSLVRSTAFKPVIPRSTASSTETGQNSLDRIICPPEKARSPNTRHRTQDTFSGTLSDSGRNSMSSLPTHSTSGSLSASTGPVSHSDGGSSAPANRLCGSGAQPSLPVRVNRNSANLDCVCGAGLNGSELTSSKVNGDAGSPLSADAPSPLSETAGGIRSPITPDESLIERLEQRLLERESELQELQVSFEEKEMDTCQLFEERQRYCAEEMEGLKQRCSTKLRQVSQMTLKTQQALQLQVSQLQAEKEKLQEDFAQLTRDKGLVELRLRSYESESTQLVPTLEETQWEICQKSGEISLLKQQLRDCKADINHKLNDIVNLRASLRENTAKMEIIKKKNKDQEDDLHSRTREVEVCQNELQRKKNEADLLREKVGKLETDIQGMKQDLATAKEQSLQHRLQPEAGGGGVHTQTTQASDRIIPAGSDPGATARGPGDEEDGGGRVFCTESLQKQVERLQQRLREEAEARERQAKSFERERHTWNKEKDRVIKYQKQLQCNYVQMLKKNRDLERILKELSAELESRTELNTYSSGLQTYDDVIATEI